jgi:CRP-like cAMP-binding protein
MCSSQPSKPIGHGLKGNKVMDSIADKLQQTQQNLSVDHRKTVNKGIEELKER